jgi:hypothetical protein
VGRKNGKTEKQRTKDEKNRAKAVDKSAFRLYNIGNRNSTGRRFGNAGF